MKLGAGAESNVEHRGRGNPSVDDASGSDNILGDSTPVVNSYVRLKSFGLDERTVAEADLRAGCVAAIRSLQKLHLQRFFSLLI